MYEQVYTQIMDIKYKSIMVYEFNKGLGFMPVCAIDGYITIYSY